jgi:type I restriction enzyme S subunit
MRRARVGYVLELQRRPVEVDPIADYEEIGVRSFGKGIFHKDPVKGADLGKKRVFRIEPGDLILSNVFAWEGAIAIASEGERGKVGSHRFMTYSPKDESIDASWASWFFRSEVGLGLIRHASPGSAGRNRTLAIDRFEKLEIPLPPVDDQRQIARGLDRLSAAATRARAVRARATELADALFRSRFDALFSEIPGPVCALAEIADVKGGVPRTPLREPGSNPVRYLTVAHVMRDAISLSDPRFFEVPPEELERRVLRRGDVLIIEGNGSAEQIGRTALFRGEIDTCVHQNHVIRARPNRWMVSPDFLNDYLNSPAGQRAVQEQSRTSSGLRSLSVGRIMKIAVPVPPLEKQREIVHRSQELKSEKEVLRPLVDRSAVLMDALTPAAVNEAFARFN